VSDIDGNKYCVRDRTKLADAADLLARVTTKCKKLVDYMYDKYPDNEVVQRLKQNYNPNKIMETLRQARIRRIAKIKAKNSVLFKQNNKNNDKLIDEHTLMFVAIHEMSHTCTKSVGHKSEFWENFKFLLENAKESKIHIPVDYTKSPVEYCDMTIKDNPYYAA
jgi:hypothetical protein